MSPLQYKETVCELLTSAGIQINGSGDADITVHDERLYKRMLTGSLGLGESYMEGWWDCPRVDEFIYKLLRAKVDERIKKSLKNLFLVILAHLSNQQTTVKSLRVANLHYNLDNDFYRDMLGPTMSYTCAYWKDAKTLDQAQNNKHELVCRKLNLKKGEKVLELGCGWGGFAHYAATHYGVEMVSVNISKEQIKYARELCKDLPVQIVESDYRHVHNYNPNKKQFDKVVSIGMCEHVGYKNYGGFLEIASQNLKDEGLFLLHTIGGNIFSSRCEPWTNKYIFPGGVLPSIHGLSQAMENRFIMEDWHNFGAYYDPTLMAWYKNFIQHWDQHKEHFNDTFYRMWSYYLLSCAGMFRARGAQLWQIVMSKNGLLGGYQSVR